jgi:ATP-binding cassette subfamily B protein
MLLSAFVEMISLGSVLPFIGVLVAPDRIFEYQFAANMAQGLGIATPDQLVLPLTIVFAAAALIAGVIRILLLWLSSRIAFASGAEISVEVYRRTLYQPYWVHVARNSSEVISGITGKVASAAGVAYHLLSLVSSTILLAVITIALVAINPAVAMVAFIGFGVSYALITWIARRQLHINSQIIASEQTQIVKSLQEGLGGIRDVLLDGTQSVYCDIYAKADHRFRRAQGNSTFISQSPRYVLEAIGMALIAALAYSFSREGGGVAIALPILGVFALGAQRLLPALQQIYSSWASIAVSQASLADILALLDQPMPSELLEPAPKPLIIQNMIRFDAVSFRYSDDSPWVLNGFSMIIPRGSRVGFVGSTGSGKSTTLDLLMGLLMPTRGQILIDEQPLASNCIRAWQRTIAHVPQTIYLSDSTMAENIAFGVPFDDIDFDRVQIVARQAQISDFIESSSRGYQTYVGERGMRLSGGQRQRIGIARALYKEASVLVFDEATSALDSATEQSVMDAIEGLSSDLTILIIAHRLSTVERCDSIIELENGQVLLQGTYEELLKCSPSFRKW